jgi:hypothetical protein
VVDDDAPIRRMLERTLDAEGYDVRGEGARRRPPVYVTRNVALSRGLPLELKVYLPFLSVTVHVLRPMPRTLVCL